MAGDAVAGDSVAGHLDVSGDSTGDLGAQMAEDLAGNTAVAGDTATPMTLCMGSAVTTYAIGGSSLWARWEAMASHAFAAAVAASAASWILWQTRAQCSLDWRTAARSGRE